MTSLTSVGVVRTPEGNAVVDKPSLRGRAPVPPLNIGFVTKSPPPQLAPMPAFAEESSTGFHMHEAPSAGTASGKICSRQPRMTSGSICPSAWRADTAAGRRARRIQPEGADHAHHAQRSSIVRHVVAHHAAHPERGVRFRVVQRHIDAVRGWPGGAIEVDADRLVVDRQRAGYMHRFVVAVHIHLVPERTVRQGRDFRAHRLFRRRYDSLAYGVDGVEFEISHHLEQLVTAGRIARRQRVQVTFRHHRIPHIGANDVHQRLVQFAATKQVTDGNVDSFLEYLVRVRAETAATDIGDVTGAGEQGDGTLRQ